MNTTKCLLVAAVAFSVVPSVRAQLVFPDNTEQSSAGIVLTRTFVVGSGGTPAQNGAALKQVVEVDIPAIVPGGEPFRYRVLLDAGHYDLSGTTLMPPEFVEIQGAGAGNSLLFGNGPPTVKLSNQFVVLSNLTVSGVVKTSPVVESTASNTALRGVEIEHSAVVEGTRVGLAVSSGSIDLDDVSVTMIGNAEENVAVLVSGTGSLTAFNCDFDTSGAGLLNTAVAVAGNGTAVLRNCRLAATGATSRGIWHGYGGDATVLSPTLTVYHSEVRAGTHPVDASSSSMESQLPFVGAFRYTHFFGPPLIDVSHSAFLYCARNGSPLPDDAGGTNQ